MNIVSNVYAQSAPPAPGAATTVATTSGAPQQPGIMSMVTLFAPMFLVIYFFIIRPQQKKMKEQQGMLDKLQHGDEVITTSGIYGKITGITDKILTVEVADNVRIKMLKSQIASVNPGKAASA